MASSIRRGVHMSRTMSQWARLQHPASFLSSSLQPHHLDHLHQSPHRRDFTQSTYDIFFSPNPPHPTLWNNAIWCADYYFSALHDYMGLSWGWSVVLGTVFLRSIVTLPLLIYGEICQDRLLLLLDDPVLEKQVKKQVMFEIQQTLRQNPSFVPPEGWMNRRLNFGPEKRRAMKEQYVKNNCHPIKKLALPLIQIPLWFASSIALRNICGAYGIDGAMMLPTRPDMAHEPFLWLSDLTLSDSTFVIPFFVGLTYLILIEFNLYKMYNGEPVGKRARIVLTMLRGHSIFIMPYFAYILPTTVSLYWLSSGAIGLIHNIIIMTPAVRRSFGITLRASPDDAPGKTIWRGFKGHWKIK